MSSPYYDSDSDSSSPPVYVGSHSPPPASGSFPSSGSSKTLGSVPHYSTLSAPDSRTYVSGASGTNGPMTLVFTITNDNAFSITADSLTPPTGAFDTFVPFDIPAGGVVDVSYAYTGGADISAANPSSLHLTGPGLDTYKSVSFASSI